MRIEFRYNGDANLILYPETEDDWKALDLLMNGKTVKDVQRPVRESERECATITFSRQTQ